jgi:hypothetical protein
MIAYKLMKLRRNGTLGPLFINARMVVPLGEWLEAEDHPTKGFAHRPGWHCTLKPVAPHLSERNRVWVEVEIEDYRFFNRPTIHGGVWALANRMKALRVMTTQEVRDAQLLVEPGEPSSPDASEQGRGLREPDVRVDPTDASGVA